MTADAFPRAEVSWQRAWRVIPSKYPPIQLFEDLSRDPADWDLLAEIETAVNPRYRQQIGQISLVPVEHRVASTVVMAPFVHLNPLGSRFSDGSFGVFYAPRVLETAIRETIFHLERRLRAGRAASDDMDQRVYVGAIAGRFVDLTRAPEAAAPLLDPDDYRVSRTFGSEVRAAGEDGILYPSVRHPGHEAIAVFAPPRIASPVQERHLRYHWDGERITRWFDYSVDEWMRV